jgi:hypothetical protein
MRYVTERTSRSSGRVVDSLVDAAAVYRLVRLYQNDSLTEPIRTRIDDWLLKHGHHKAMELSQCPHCLAVWIAAGVVAARAVSPRVWDMIARALAFSAVTGVVTSAVDRLDS